MYIHMFRENDWYWAYYLGPDMLSKDVLRIIGEYAIPTTKQFSERLTTKQKLFACKEILHDILNSEETHSIDEIRLSMEIEKMLALDGQKKRTRDMFLCTLMKYMGISAGDIDSLSIMQYLDIYMVSFDEIYDNRLRFSLGPVIDEPNSEVLVIFEINEESIVSIEVAFYVCSIFDDDMDVSIQYFIDNVNDIRREENIRNYVVKQQCKPRITEIMLAIADMISYIEKWKQ